MKFLYSEDPIIACATGQQTGAAIALIRISGFPNLDALLPFFTLSGPIEPRKVYFTRLVLQGQVLDELCLTYFEAPRSYNGENILELSVHGNSLNVDRILDLFLSYGGCRLAQPGEFTYRALKNKKLSLSQVEGLDLLLNANSGYALDQGLSLLSGNLHATLQELFDLFLIHKSSLELSIDFSEDIGEEGARAYFHSSLENFAKKFLSLVKRVQPLEQNLLSPEIVLVGLPNSGKSSLFNLLLEQERAIVSSVPGTTRDYISEPIVSEGVKYKLIDTAGIRVCADEIESEGIRRSKDKLTHSFFSILLINPFEIMEGFDELMQRHYDLILFTHADLPGFEHERLKLLESYPALGPIGTISLVASSQVTEALILQAVNKKYFLALGDKPILLDRHKALVLQANLIFSRYQQLAFSESDVAILSHELNALGHCISELVGIVSPDQVLNSIFSNFCIGK
jgi:tRNA modification GTPase